MSLVASVSAEEGEKGGGARAEDICPPGVLEDGRRF